ncbi:MAG: hypothetical protein DM484_22955 [Candidatus Methylumidiphilus alinenensis]|uniref:Uncharacterized protein n=1 Tax=Candidatus Methylumidiphilus alinenensis TaxID=2202197 RepID=A0A2W4SP81_9GAMM|nr:MAG: hypothetical protein DM484_22955 [Candidatus Methylumidiphilus alinenensis]
MSMVTIFWIKQGNQRPSINQNHFPVFLCKISLIPCFASAEEHWVVSLISLDELHLARQTRA